MIVNPFVSLLCFYYFFLLSILQKFEVQNVIVYVDSSIIVDHNLKLVFSVATVLLLYLHHNHISLQSW